MFQVPAIEVLMECNLVESVLLRDGHSRSCLAPGMRLEVLKEPLRVCRSLQVCKRLTVYCRKSVVIATAGAACLLT